MNLFIEWTFERFITSIYRNNRLFKVNSLCTTIGSCSCLMRFGDFFQPDSQFLFNFIIFNRHKTIIMYAQIVRHFIIVKLLYKDILCCNLCLEVKCSSFKNLRRIWMTQ